MTKDNVKNKSRMQITNCNELVEPIPINFEVYNADNKRISDAQANLNSLNLSMYLLKDDIDKFQAIFNKLVEINKSKLLTDLIQIEAVHLANFSIEKIKSIADKNSDTVSKPASTGFREFVLNRIELLKNIVAIHDNLSRSENNNCVLLGSIDGKGQIYINSKYRMLCPESRTSEFSHGITRLREIKEMLDKMSSKIFSSNVASLVSEFTEACREDSISSTKDFLGTSKQVVTEDGAEYVPSNGEKGILLLQKSLESGADAYFLDEPELGMGNSFIDTNIRPILSDLAKQHKTVVVATHNANIAVRTLPYMSIYRTHQNGVYKTYTGNPFEDRLVNIDDPEDVKSWTTESLHTLEGGKEAFYERKSIYETNGSNRD